MTEKGSKIPQFVAGAAACLVALSNAVIGGWSSPVLPKLENGEGPFGPITKEQSSWIGSLMAVGAIIGSVVTGYLGERWGRKRILLFSVVPSLIGWTLVATARHVAQLYVARFIFGMAMSSIFAIVPLYCGEIAETSVRGALGSLFQLFITFGVLYAYATGPFVNYTVYWIICTIPTVIFFICFVMMPESPYFLLGKGHKDEAIASLARLRSKSKTAVQDEVDEMQATLDEASKNQASVSDLFKVKANYKALFYSCTLITFQQCTGINIVLVYMHNIFIAAGGSVSMEVAPIIIAAVQMLSSMVTPIIVDRSGRKILLVISGIGELISLFALGLYFYLKEVQHADEVIEQLSWLPVVALIIFIGTYSVGSGPIPWAMMGEIFASNIKAKASSITVFVHWTWSFIFTKFSSNLEDAFNGQYATYWICAGFCFFSILFTVFLLPETKGKSFQQIQDELNGVTSTTNENVIEKRGENTRI